MKNVYPHKNKQLLFFPTSEGYVKAVYDHFDNSAAPKYQYVYNYTDHLGNIRMSYTANRSGIAGVAKKMEEIDFRRFANSKEKMSKANTKKSHEQTHYYPFGLKHGNYNQAVMAFTIKEAFLNSINGASIKEVRREPAVANSYKYKYNGKEWQDEFNLNMYDLGARGHDPARVNFGSIDPRAEEYYSQSPYVFASNNPVFFVDINGEGVDWLPQVNDDGSTSYIAEEGDSVETFMSQYGVSQENAESLVGCDPVEAGITEVYGQDVYDLNPYNFDNKSPILKLDTFSTQATDSRVLQQFYFAIQSSKTTGSKSFFIENYFDYNKKYMPSTGLHYRGIINVDNIKYKAHFNIKYFSTQNTGTTNHSNYYSNSSGGAVQDRSSTLLGGVKTRAFKIEYGPNKNTFSSNRASAFTVRSIHLKTIQKSFMKDFPIYNYDGKLFKY